MIKDADQIPQSIHFFSISPLMNCDKNPPTKASPAPFVSTIFSDSIFATLVSENSASLKKKIQNKKLQNILLYKFL